ncbi:MAG: hypothetical protein GX628_00205 [Clostridiales bacterium]|nr:hypothetical protein [Clostridiales bacterium]
MIFKRITALLLASVLLCGALAACSGGGGETSPDGSDTTAAETTPEETTLFMPDDLPADLDFKGAKVNVFWWEENREFCDEQDGDIVNDALYFRDMNVEDRINVKIQNNPMSYTWATRNVYLDTIRSAVLAGDGTQDIASCQYATLPALVPDGNFLDIAKLPYVDLDKPWYVQGLIEETTIDGRLYLVGGAYSKISISGAYGIYFNKMLHENYKLENLYDLVDSGSWVIAKMQEMTKGVYSDINGDGTAGNEDQYGFAIFAGNAITPFIQAFRLGITTNNKEGYPELTMNTPKWVEAVDLMHAYIHTSGDCVMGNDNIAGEISAIFVDDRALFISHSIGAASSTFGEMETDFGIIPLLKWDEAQEGYNTAIGEGNTLFGIVTSTSNAECTAAVMEACFSESYRTVAPALFEVAMKVKYSRDNETAQMFDIIREGILFNFGSIYGFGLKEINTRWKAYLANKSGSGWASFIAQIEEPATAAINDYIEAVRNLPER